MKRLILQFANQVLSKNDLRQIKGGDNPYGGGGCGSFCPDGSGASCERSSTGGCVCKNRYYCTG